MTPFLSICIPSYNRFDLLVNICNELLRLPSYFYEFVICDDKSDDLRISGYLKDLEKLDTRVSVFFNESNLGISGNYRKILSLARGKYAMLLSNEDRLMEGFDDFWSKYIASKFNYDLIISKVKYSGNSTNLYVEDAIFNSFSFRKITHSFPYLIFEAHISGKIFKREMLNFCLHEKVTDNFFPIVPFTLMSSVNQNIYLTNDTLVEAGFYVPLYIKKIKILNKWQEMWFLSFARQIFVYKSYIKKIIPHNQHSIYFEILAKSFQFFIFSKDKIGLSKIFSIGLLFADNDLSFFFKKNLTSLMKKFFRSAFRKYFC